MVGWLLGDRVRGARVRGASVRGLVLFLWLCFAYSFSFGWPVSCVVARVCFAPLVAIRCIFGRCSFLLGLSVGPYLIPVRPVSCLVAGIGFAFFVAVRCRSGCCLWRSWCRGVLLRLGRCSLEPGVDCCGGFGRRGYWLRCVVFRSGIPHASRRCSGGRSEW